MAYATNPDNFASLDAMYDLYKIPTLDEFVAAHTNRCVCNASVNASWVSFEDLLWTEITSFIVIIVKVKIVMIF